MNINEILAMFPDEEKNKVNKFYSNIIVAQGNIGNVGKVIETLAKDGLTFKKIRDLRTLTIEVDELINKIDEYKANQLFDVVRNDVSILRFKVDIIINRILDCGKTGKSYRDEEGNLYSFITNSDEWDRVYEGLNHEALNVINEKNELRTITVDDVFEAEKLESIYKALEIEEAQLDLESFDRYSRLMNNLNDVTEYLQKFEFKIKSAEALELVVRNLTAYKSDKFLDQEIVLTAIISGMYVPHLYAEEIIEVINETCSLSNQDNILESSGIRR